MNYQFNVIFIFIICLFGSFSLYAMQEVPESYDSGKKLMSASEVVRRTQILSDNLSSRRRLQPIVSERINWDDIPDEIQQYIMNFMHLTQVITLRQVSHKLRDLSDEFLRMRCQKTRNVKMHGLRESFWEGIRTFIPEEYVLYRAMEINQATDQKLSWLRGFYENDIELNNGIYYLKDCFDNQGNPLEVGDKKAAAILFSQTQKILSRLAADKRESIKAGVTSWLLNYIYLNESLSYFFENSYQVLQGAALGVGLAGFDKLIFWIGKKYISELCPNYVIEFDAIGVVLGFRLMEYFVKGANEYDTLRFFPLKIRQLLVPSTQDQSLRTVFTSAIPNLVGFMAGFTTIAFKFSVFSLK